MILRDWPPSTTCMPTAFWKNSPRWKKVTGKRPGTVGEQRVVVAIADLAPFLVVDLLQDLGRGARRRLVGPVRALARLRLEEIVRERDRRLELQAVGLGGSASPIGLIAAAAAATPFENRATINVIRHD